ncbi:Fluoroquinolones export ATP-binding protein Rv2688c/MT2762 [Aedoeadaptatus ivorii]|uniref:Fluoroquinolones export ATP-binding protein Rv2688c/MT2762 n=1 Tax=Aedoeadaptatus ivorii TaxID=54006 RepID=A0A3S5C2W1_9FIRM|nr:ABC transporter ATP-binding protein [Peptoniphilus ivorii]MDQ0508275.1 ABC-2 type transport system ATP-binding protein [Peptoniphilus ivorii]VEJ36249.1 Fluoroquinolones export ATP-binding protein Rv2688c/MT2762 [Peptoniphilus ivorii]
MELIIDAIDKSFGDNQVLRGASARFSAGKIYGILGRNGAGKTTLFDLISGKKPYDAGGISIEEDGKRREIVDGDVFYMVADPQFPNFLTGREFIRLYLDLYGRREDADALFDYAEIDEKNRDMLIQHYSLGTKNKLQMLMFLLTAPRVILMDEPLTSLDVVIQQKIKEVLKDLKRDRVVLFSTHIVALAKDLCDEAVLIQGKKLVETDSDFLRASAGERLLAKRLS